MLQSGVMWKARHMQPGSRARFRALEALGFSVLKYTFFHFLETLFPLISDIYFNTKNG